MNAYSVVVSVLRETKEGDTIEGYLAHPSEHGIARELCRAQLFPSPDAAMCAVIKRKATLGRMFWVRLGPEVEAAELNHAI